MRKRKDNGKISVNAISGSHVVLLGLNAEKEAAKGLLGFTIRKRKGKSTSFQALGGGERRFKETDSSKRVDSRTAPIQDFMWSDYVVDPGQTYTYRVIPVYGKPEALKKGKHHVDVTITTEDPEHEMHGIYFNRGVAGSQAYSRRFGEHLRWYLSNQDGKPKATPFIKPQDVPNREAYKWLSRGLEEAMAGFIDQATGPEYKIRAAVYELTYVPIIQKFVNALERGVDVKIVHHAKRETSYRLKGVGGKKGEPKLAKPTTTTTWTEGEVPKDAFNLQNAKKYVVKEESNDAVCQAADAAVAQVGLSIGPDNKNFEKYCHAFDQMLIERTITTISHNKFMVLLKNGKPIQVWTGSTNYTEGGIFGQSNVGHVVRDAEVAGKYYDYWKKLSTDPKKKSGKNDPPYLGMQNWTVKQQPVLKGLPPVNSITPVFNPQLKPKKGDKDMLDWYAERLDGAKHSVFLTSAFSIAKQFLDIVKDVKKVDGKPYTATPYLRYLLLEGKGGLLKDKYPIIKKCRQNRVAYGDKLRRRTDEDEHQQFIETLTGLNDHVNYLHTKYMLIDPLSDDPIVITGSANFSDASTHDNDENMLIIRGNTRVADIFLGEFMRLFNHFEYRNRENSLSDAAAEKARFLKGDDSWTKPYYQDGSPEQNERLLFS
jgi:phosphatidylserine/phosphatidylglycerophosphate/cardiolipin synthase-like enzyme